MKKIGFLGLISISLIVVGLISLKPEIVGMSFPFLLYILSGLLTQPSKVNLIFNRSLSHSRVLTGTIVEISLTVENRGESLETVVVEDVLSNDLKITDGSSRHIIKLANGESYSWQYSIEGKRGLYKFDSINVETRDRYGIFPQKQTFPTSGELLVLPEMMNVKRLSIRPRKTRVYSGEIPAKSGGLGVEFYGVREFQPGDPPNWINWRASARHQSTLFSNEFEQERVADVGIILDGRERSNLRVGENSIFDYSVQAAATLANTFIKQGDRVSLLHYGKYLHWIYPGYGKYQRERILRALVNLKPGHSMVFAYLENLPTQIFPAQSQIVIISALLDEDTQALLQLRARGYSVLVIRPDPLLFEKNSLKETPYVQIASRILSLERIEQHQKLIESGIRVIDWDVSKPLEQVIGNLQRAPVFIHSVRII